MTRSPSAEVPPPGEGRGARSGVRRILYVQHDSEVSGSIYSLLYLVRSLDPTRYEATVLFHAGEGPAVDIFRQAKVRTIVRRDISFYGHADMAHYSFRSARPWLPITELLRIPASVRRMADLLRRDRYDLIHLNTSLEVPAALGAHRAGTPFFWHIREPLRHGVFGLRRRLIQRLFRRLPSRAIAISEHEASTLGPNDRLTVIHNFVDFSRFDRSVNGAGVRAELGLSPQAPVIGMLGGAVPHKGALVLIRAAAILRREFPDLRVLVVGCRPPAQSPSAVKRAGREALRVIGVLPDYRREMERCIAALGLGGIVDLIGVRTDIPAVLAAMDVVTFPATVAHFPRPVIEAQAMARPAVASAAGGALELISHGKDGMLVPPRDPEALAGAIASVLRDPPLARNMGEAAYARARRMFDVRRNAARIIAMYDEFFEGEAGR